LEEENGNIRKMDLVSVKKLMNLDRIQIIESLVRSEFGLESTVECTVARKKSTLAYRIIVDGNDSHSTIACSFTIKTGETEKLRDLERSRLLDLNANIQAMLNAQLYLNLHGARVYGDCRESSIPPIRDSTDILFESKFNARHVGISSHGMDTGFKNRFLNQDMPGSGSHMQRSKSYQHSAEKPASRPRYARSKSSETVPSFGIPRLPKRIETKRFKTSSSSGSLTPPLPPRTLKLLIPQVVNPSPRPSQPPAIVDEYTDVEAKSPSPHSAPIPTPPPETVGKPPKRNRKVLCPGGIARYVPSKFHSTSLLTCLYLFIQVGIVIYLSIELDFVVGLLIWK
jgi:hypothetical protein